MLRATLNFMAGILSAALMVSAVSVYVLHDVDREEVGHLNQAFVGLCVECVLFALFVGGAVALLTSLGQRFLKSKGFSPRARRSLVLGISVSLLQYAWDFVARKYVPQASDNALYAYLVVAVVLCSALMILDGLQQRKKHRASVVPFD